MADYVLGAAGVLYYSATPLSGRPGDPGTPDTFANVTWLEIANVTDVDTSGDSESIDATTREEAKLGWQSEILGPSSGEITFSMRHKPGNAAYEALREAWLFKKSIALLDLDEPKTVEGASGLVANFTVQFGHKKPVKGVQMVDVTAKIAGYPNYVEVDTGVLTAVVES